MGLKLYEETSVQAIADAIRAKNGSSDTYTVAQMSTAIADIPTGGGGDIYKYHWSNDGKICVREGLGEVKWFFKGLTFPSDSYDIAVPRELYEFLPKTDVSAREYPNDSSTTFTGYIAIGVSSAFPTQTFRNYDTGWNGYPGATVYGVIDINDGSAQMTTYTDPLDVPDIDISLIEKTITENGTYSAEDDGYVGYSDVVVNTPTRPSDTGYNQIFKDNSMDVRFDLNGKFKVIWDGVTNVDVGCTMQGHTNLIGTYNNINIKGNIIDSCEYHNKYGYERTQFVVGVTGTNWQTAILVGYNDNGDVYKKEVITLTDQQVVNDIDIDIDLNELAQQGHQSAYLFISLLGISGEFEVTIT